MPRRVPPGKKPARGKQRRIRQKHQVTQADIARFRQLLELTGEQRRQVPAQRMVDPQMRRFVHEVVLQNIAGTTLNAAKAARQIAERYGGHEHVGFALQALPANIRGPMMLYLMETLRGKKPD